MKPKARQRVGLAPGLRAYGRKLSETHKVKGSGESWWTDFAVGERRDEAYMAEVARRWPEASPKVRNAIALRPDGQFDAA